jgi:glycosyltransferase involved in cell wall biosynthesis
MRQYSIVIPTKDREKDLNECVDSVLIQTLNPDEVLVIDDGNLSERFKTALQNKLTQKNIGFRYFKKQKPGLSESKNWGAKEAKSEIVLFLDDDVVLEKDYAEHLLKVWQENWQDKELAGVSGIIKNSRKKSFLEKLFNKIFCLDSKKTWSILPWGFQTWDFYIKSNKRAEWAPGGTTSFRKEIFDFFQFKSLQPGRTASEDIEISWKLKDDGYYFIITPFAKLTHKESPISREKDFILGIKDGANRRVIFHMHAPKNIKNYFCFCMAAMGSVLRQLLCGNFEKGLGIAIGYFKK